MSDFGDVIKKIVTIAVIGVVGFHGYQLYKAKSFVDTVFVGQASRSGAEVNYSRIMPSLFGGVSVYGVTIKGPDPKAPSMKAGRITLEEFTDNEQGLRFAISYADSAIVNLDASAKEFDEMRSDLREFTNGDLLREVLFAPYLALVVPQEALKIDFSSPADGRFFFYLDRKKHTIESGGENIQAAFGKVAMRVFVEMSDGDYTPQTAFEMSRIRDAEFTFVDDGLMAKYLPAIAKQHNIPDGELARRLDARLDEALAKQELRLWPDVVKSLKAYFHNPVSIRAELKPEKPLPLRDLGHYSAADLPALLNLSVITPAPAK